MYKILLQAISERPANDNCHSALPCLKQFTDRFPGITVNGW